MRHDPRRIILLIGRGGECYAARMCRENPDLAERVHATGELEPVALALHLAACDLLLQPYAEGLTARRTSLMASAALGLPVVSSRGPLTEPIWDSYQAVCLVDNSPAAWTEAVERLLSDANARAALGRQARQLYQDCFAVEHCRRPARTTSPGHAEGGTAVTSSGPRRVLHIVPSLFGDDGKIIGGAERYALELARHMAPRVPTRLVRLYSARERPANGKARRPRAGQLPACEG